MTPRAVLLRIGSTVAVGLAAATAATGSALAAPTISGKVSSGTTGLKVRAAATTTSAVIGNLRNGAPVVIECAVVGHRVKGRVRTTTRWDRLAGGAFISDAYVKRSAAVPLCPPAPVAEKKPTPVNPAPVPPAPPAQIVPPTGWSPVGKWVSPVPGRGSSGFRTIARPTHDGVDIMAARETPIRAAAAGTVIRVVCNTSGPSCDVDGSPTTTGCGWYAEIAHAGDLVTRYCHLVRQPHVAVGDRVTAGEIFGYVGSSGHSSGPHLHFEVHYGGPPATRLNAIDPVAFMATAGAPVA